MADMGLLSENSDKIYRYMNFDQIEDFREIADSVGI
jgi:aconitate hydratase 2/2-methylisocitrate dehydratase